MEMVVDRVGKQYRSDFWGLKSFNLELCEGVLGLLEPNGAGKSMLMLAPAYFPFICAAAVRHLSSPIQTANRLVTRRMLTITRMVARLP